MATEATHLVFTTGYCKETSHQAAPLLEVPGGTNLPCYAKIDPCDATLPYVNAVVASEETIQTQTFILSTECLSIPVISIVPLLIKSLMRFPNSRLA